MKNLSNLARELAIKNKKHIARITDNRDCACESIVEYLLQETGKKIENLSEEELENYWDAADYGYQAIENFLEYLD